MRLRPGFSVEQPHERRFFQDYGIQNNRKTVRLFSARPLAPALHFGADLGKKPTPPQGKFDLKTNRV